MMNEAFFTTYGVFKNLLIEILKPPKGNLLKSFSQEIGTSDRDPDFKEARLYIAGIQRSPSMSSRKFYDEVSKTLKLILLN